MTQPTKVTIDFAMRKAQEMTVKRLLIDTLYVLPKERRVVVLGDLIDMYEAELITGLGENK